jgi:dTDP-4-dehydrorhamnose reductase
VGAFGGAELMRILILGGTGMLGHKMHEILSHEHDVVSTTRRPLSDLPVDPSAFLHKGTVIEKVDASQIEALERVVADVRPDALINCVGVIKQRDAAHFAIPSISINALLPHQLAELCAGRGARLVHFSTDCVFSGAEGDYTEESISDATDLYGRSKFLGEVSDEHALTIRSSIIGRELDHFGSLVEWFLRQRGQIKGFTHAIYTGVTTSQMALIVSRLLLEQAQLTGLYQIASEKVSKYELLMMLREAFGLEDRIQIEPSDQSVCDRSLRGDKFLAATGIRVSPWQDMLQELASHADRYEGVRS